MKVVPIKAHRHASTAMNLSKARRSAPAVSGVVPTAVKAIQPSPLATRSTPLTLAIRTAWPMHRRIR